MDWTVFLMLVMLNLTLAHQNVDALVKNSDAAQPV